MIIYIALYLLAVFISSFSQVLLKISAIKEHNSVWQEYVNLYVIVAYGLFFLSTLATMYAYKVLPLSYGPVLDATGYIWVSFLGKMVLKEKIPIRKIIGLLLIIVGIVISIC